MIDMNKNILNIICGRCGGKCCKSYLIFLTKKELKGLLKLGARFKYKKAGAGYLMDCEQHCDFLNKHGCRLPSRLKPFDCKLYPLAFIYAKEKIDFYLIKECPYFKKIDNNFLKKWQNRMKKRINRLSQKEKISYSRLIENYPKDKLMKL